MTCFVRIYYDAIRIPGTPSANGIDYIDGYVDISVPNGDYIGEMIPDGGGFGPCPGVTQFVIRARNPGTGDIISNGRSVTCHNLIFKRYENSCPPSKYDCINGECKESTIYDTPGIYNSLSECEINCGSQGCSGKCIPNADWTAIQNLSNQLKNKNCS